MMIEKSGTIRLRDIPTAAGLSPKDQELAAGMVRVTHLYRSALKVAVTQMEILDEEFARLYDHSPIHHIEYRIKTLDSIIDKLRRRGLEVSIDNIYAHIQDVAGIRVICNYLDDIYYLRSLLTRSESYTVLREVDYIKEPKDTGYRSLHLIDPGQELVALCAENGVTVQAIPGCCAAIAALAVSGLDTRRFTFEGFLPSGKKERRAALEELTGEARTMVFHEAPHRLRQTLADMAELLGDRPAALCRELTKLHEDTVRTTLAQAAAFYRDNEPRGEYVLVVAGREKQNLPALTLEEGAARVLALRDGGMKLKEAVRRVADDTGLPRNALYDTALKA